MKRFAPELRLCVVLAAAAGILGRPPCVRAGWWDLNWPCRREVNVEDYKPTGLPGDDVAVVTMPTGGFVKPGGGDVRVATPQGSQRPSRVLMVGPGDVVRVAFAIRPGVTKYYVYFGHDKPPKPAEKLELRRGVLLETWAYTGGGVSTLADVRKIFTAGRKPFVGADFRDRIFIGHSPFGPHSRVARTFTAHLICPADGDYTFVTSSRNSSFLLIDGRLVVDNGGWHAPQRDIRKKGRVKLTRGPHKLTMYHVSGGGDPVAVAAWMPPGKQRVQVIPPAAFAPVFRAAPAAMEQRGRAAGVDFLYEHAGEAFMAGSYHQRYEFRALAVGRPGRKLRWQWDFGDGQKTEGERVEHVYLTDGPRAVTLTVRTGIGVFERTNRVWVSRPWDRVTQSKQEDLRSYGRIVARYDMAALGPKALHQAVMLFDRVGNAEAINRAGRAFVRSKEVTDHAASGIMPIYVAALRRQKRHGEAVDELVKTSEKVRSPAAAASLAVSAGRICLDDLADAKTALSLFDGALKKYAHLTTAPAIRSARIGLGDAHRAAGDREKAAEAYKAAGTMGPVGVKAAAARGNFARYVEDFTRRRLFKEAAERLDEWEASFPADKLEGYSTLLRVRLLMAEEDYRRASREAEITVRVNPASNYAPALLLLASQAHRRLGKAGEADENLRRIVADYPESSLAAEAAKQLPRP